VIRAEDSEETHSARTWRIAEWIASRSVGFSRCSSPSPVSVRIKILPLFSNVHISGRAGSQCDAGRQW
jgi:hypothetical protein